MAKSKNQTAPRCCECKGLMKDVTHQVNLLGGSMMSIMCDHCYHQTLQCDVCYDLTSFAEGAAQNHDEETFGVHGDGIVCSDCDRSKEAVERKQCKGCGGMSPTFTQATARSATG